MYGMRWLVLKEWRSASFAEWLDLLVGATERFVALTLVICAPPYLPAFIGGWVALKFALGWQREARGDEVQRGSLLAMIGNVLSFAIAVGVGLALNPKALEVWATTAR
jgi:hypothetical protein